MRDELEKVALPRDAGIIAAQDDEPAKDTLLTQVARQSARASKHMTKMKAWKFCGFCAARRQKWVCLNSGHMLRAERGGWRATAGVCRRCRRWETLQPAHALCDRCTLAARGVVFAPGWTLTPVAIVPILSAK